MNILTEPNPDNLGQKITLIGYMGVAGYILTAAAFFFGWFLLTEAASISDGLFGVLGAYDLVSNHLTSALSIALAQTKIAGIGLIIMTGAVSFYACSRSSEAIDIGIGSDKKSWMLGGIGLVCILTFIEPVSLCIPRTQASFCGDTIAYIRLFLPVVMLGLLVWATPPMVGYFLFSRANE